MFIEPQLAWAKTWLKQPKRNYIDGEWVAGSSSAKWQATNPANGESLCSFQQASAADVDRAARAGQVAFKSGVWWKSDARERARTIRKIGQLVRDHVGELATIETLANGKLYKEALFDDMPDAGDIFDYYAGWVDKFYGENCPVADGFINYTVKEPLGVCGLIVPWNFPLLLTCWKLAPALATGNSVIVKPSEYTSLSMIRLVELIDEKLALPPGVLNLVLGSKETGQAISESQLVDKVSFTGSTAVGKNIVKKSSESNLKRITLELGGKSPNIFFEDTPDLPAAIDRAYGVMFSQKGEKCSEPTRLLVHRSIYENVLLKLKEIADAVVCGDPFDEASQQGSQCNEAQFLKIMDYIDSGKKDGFRLISGGERDTSGDNSKGFFIRPTIFADVDNKSKIAQEEIFGPVLVVIPFDNEEEAVAIANDSVYGLAAGLYTADISRAHRVAGQLEAGMVFINRYGCYDFSSPFGGFKQSGWGKEMAVHSLESYTKTKSVWVKI